MSTVLERQCLHQYVFNGNMAGFEFNVLPISEAPSPYIVDIYKPFIPLWIVVNNGGTKYIIDTAVNLITQPDIYLKFALGVRAASLNYVTQSLLNEQYTPLEGVGNYGNYLFLKTLNSNMAGLGKFNQEHQIAYNFFNFLPAATTQPQLYEQLQRLIEWAKTSVSMRMLLAPGRYTFPALSAFATAWDAYKVTSPSAYGLAGIELDSII